RLKPDPVPPELIRKILEAGTAAPSGGNMQRWRFLVVTDSSVKQAVGAYYKRAWDEVVYPRYSAGDPAPGTNPERFRRMLDAAQYLADHIDLPRRAEHTSGGASTRVGCDLDDTVSDLRKGGGGRSRLAGLRAFICALADRLPDGPVRAGSAGAAYRS